jgi:hypothetical protein
LGAKRQTRRSAASERARALRADPGDITIDDIRDFIAESEAGDFRRRTEDAERERQRQAAELEAAQTREQAANAAAAASRRIARRTLAGLAVAVVLALIAIATGSYGLSQKEIAISARNEALLSQSKFLADYSQQEIRNDPATALLLSLEALPDETSDDINTKSRPPWTPAAEALANALGAMRERAVFGGFEGPVTSVAMNPDGNIVLVGSTDNTVGLWDAKTFAKLGRLEPQGGRIYAVAVTPGGARIITGSDDGVARIWDAKTFVELAQLKGHQGPINALAVTPDGTRIITGSDDRTVRIWDSRTFEELGRLKGHDGWIYAIAVMPNSTGIVTGSSDNTVRIWDSKTFAEQGRDCPAEC